ncbi:MAG TPA: hypothetical protein VMK12_04990 [Anaeromyxobacteraceae bacterium]|nr:hypothetical protein [Anaeromyxobacteraceae bacterium]
MFFHDKGLQVVADKQGHIIHAYVTELALACPVCEGHQTLETRMPVETIEREEFGLSEEQRACQPARSTDAARAITALVNRLVGHLVENHGVEKMLAWQGMMSQVAVSLCMEKFGKASEATPAPRVVLAGG